MANTKTGEYVTQLLQTAGITVNGSDPWDIQVRNDRFFLRLLSEGALGAGEAYTDRWWESEALDQTIDRFLRAKLENHVGGNWRLKLHIAKSKLFNLQAISRAFQVGAEHYDIGNDLYRAMLDKRMLYTCGYWKNANNLDEAQVAKMDLVCRKIGLEPGMTVLEFGCGFGSFAKYAAENYGAKVTGLTVSREQVKLGSEMCKGLPVEIKLLDYRKATDKYDRVVSIGILEHVGFRNYRTYMEKANETLKDDGLAFIHTIGGNTSKTIANAWTVKYIFPNGMIPSIAQIGRAMEGLFVMEDWHNFGEDYDKTLMAWHANFERAWPELKRHFDDRFYRMWRYYLLSCAGAFRARDQQLWQIVMTKKAKTQPNCRLV
ncbi:MAG: cyclopropane fatty acyl phospholipid synthase [Proteobacteria bacterium]|nr:cyclopropane fatty acyl phospholipid synthase [Pseudomonadota bacterium]